MVLRIELNDPSIGWTKYGPSQYIPERMKQWLVKYIWNRDSLSKYERAESLYIVGPSKTGKTDTCYNLLNKDGRHCKVFVIDTYTNWRAFHDYIQENGLPDFVLVDDISVEELGREWKNMFGAQKTITYAIGAKKVTIDYGIPCIYLCNPDADVFYSDEFSMSKKAWLKENLFGGEPIYLERDFINGSSVRRRNKFAGNARCKNIDPEIRKYIGFESQYFESFPQIVQDRFVNKATEKYIRELEENKENIYGIRNNSSYYSAFEHGSIGNKSFYYSGTSSAFDNFNENVHHSKPSRNSSHCDSCSSSTFGSFYDSVPPGGSNSSAYYSATSDESSGSSTTYYDASDAADAYVEWYKKNY